MTHQLLYKVFKAYDSNMFDSAFDIINTININCIDKKNRKGYNSLMIKLLIKKEMIDELLIFINNISDMMSRDYIVIIEYLNSISSEMAYQYFIENIYHKILSNKIEFKPKDIDKLVLIKNNKIIAMLDGFGMKTSFDGRNINLPKYIFSKEKINEMLSIISKNTSSKTLKKIMESKYDTVIDGGNILYSNGGKLNDKSYKNLERLIKNCNNPIIILHSKHKKKYNSIIKEKYNVIFTPFNMNDDIYIIIASLMNNSNIITNDNFGDHNATYNNDNFLRNYFDEVIIKYKIISKNKFIFMNPKFSIIRKIDNNIFIPSVNNGFFIYNL